MDKEKKITHIHSNKGMVNLNEGAGQIKAQMFVNGKQNKEDVEKLQKASSELMAAIQGAGQIDENEKAGTISLIETIQSQVEKEEKPNQGLVFVLNQKLENYLGLLTGVAAFNSTVSAFHDALSLFSKF